MPTDTCVIESREREHEQIATKANAEKEIDKAIKWVREEDKKMDEKYSRGPQPEQSTHYHIVRSLIKALQQAERERDAVVRCSKCKHLEVLNNETMYAMCRKFGHKFRQFEADTRGTGCTQGERGQQDGEGV